MNPCVRTGVIWRHDGSQAVRTGDLFFEDGRWSIKGVPHRPLPPMGVDIVVREKTAATIIAFREQYVDYYDMELMAASPDFVDSLRQHYAPLVDMVEKLPAEA